MVSTLSIGLLVGGIAKNMKSASVIACILYFPMLIFSGTTLPKNKSKEPCIFIFQNSIANRNKVSMDTTQYMT